MKRPDPKIDVPRIDLEDRDFFTQPTISAPRKNLNDLRRIIETETQIFAKVLSMQLKTLAYVNGILSKSTPLIFDGDERINEKDHQITNRCCLDFEGSSARLMIYNKGVFRFMDPSVIKNDEPEPSSDGGQNPIFSSIRFDYKDDLWMVNNEGAILKWTSPKSNFMNPKKKTVDKGNPHLSAPMVPIFGKMLRTNLKREVMACKRSNSAITIYEVGKGENDLKLFEHKNITSESKDFLI